MLGSGESEAGSPDAMGARVVATATANPEAPWKILMATVAPYRTEITVRALAMLYGPGLYRSEILLQ